MRLTGAAIKAIVAILALYAGSSEARAATAKPTCSGRLTLINGTPYNWHVEKIHSHQMKWDWPENVKAHSSYEMCYKFKKNDDDAGEVTYRIMEAPSPMSFEIQAKKLKGPERAFHVQYKEDLASLNNGRDSRIELNHVRHGGFIFVLAGDGRGESGFDVSSNPPVAWMQETFDTIGELSLRDVAMPASHDAGMFKMTKGLWGVPHNTVTQTATIYDQLRFGVRFLDIRPVHRRGTFWMGHVSKGTGSGFVGGLGAALEEIIDDINRFNKEFPGELIILDITHLYDADNDWKELSAQQWQFLYEQCSNIDDLFDGELPEDASKAPVSAYISPGGASSVIIRLPHYANQPIEGRSTEAIESTRSDLIFRAGATDSGTCPNTICLAGWDLVHNEKTGNYGCEKISKSTSQTTVRRDAAANADAQFQKYVKKIKTVEADVLNRDFDKALITTSAVKVRPVSRLEAFIKEGRMPHAGTYAETNDMYVLAADQISKLYENRYKPIRNDILRSTWTLTQSWNQMANFGVPKDSILEMAVKAHEMLFPRIWSALTTKTYPNLIEVDRVENNQFATLAMAINRHFANPFDKTIWVKRSIEARDVDFGDGPRGEEIDDVVVKAPGSSDGFFWDMENTQNYWAWKWCRARKTSEECKDEKKDYVYYRRLLEAEALDKEMEKSEKAWQKWLGKQNEAKAANRKNLEAMRRKERERTDKARRKQDAARRKQEEAERQQRKNEEAKKVKKEEKQRKKEEAERQKNRG